MAPPTAHLPNPLVGLAPRRLQELEHPPRDAALRRVKADVAREPELGVGDLAVDVENCSAAALPIRTGRAPS